MPLRKLPFRRLQHLIGLHLSTKEEPQTQQLIDELEVARKKGYLSKSQLMKVCRWKSPRAINHVRRNGATTTMKITQAAFATRSEQKKLSLLTSLSGISIPMASSVLMLTDPRRYGVLDIRVWQLLYAMGAVATNADGVGFQFWQWYQYLKILRYFSGKYGVGARDIERTLFQVHSLYQKGPLYKN